MQDKLQQARERYADAKDAMREQHARMREDMEFSNPADPKQWDDTARKDRNGRPCLTFDRTNQFIMQVVNDGRQNKPSIQCIPADSQADPMVAEKLNGIVRHIEYVSRAGHAYDMALECAARVGLGWMRVIPQIMRPETNEQEIRILRVHDPLSIVLDANSTEVDGSDAMFGFAETTMTTLSFKAAFPKAKVAGWDSEGWFGDDKTRIAEYFCVHEKKQSMIVSLDPQGQEQTHGENDYFQLRERPEYAGNNPQLVRVYEGKERTVRWTKMSGLEVLEETDFPSQFLPLIPVVGYELWIDGKRYLCGMTRRLMDGQRFHNYAASATAEAIAAQPKAPFMVAFEGIENFESDWKKLNSGNPSYLPFNAWDAEGRQLPQPSRLAPPVMGQGFAGLLEYSSASMESAVGMHKANLGQQGNETSGRAIKARQQEGDTANFHYIDNVTRAIEQLGRVVVDMIPRLYDTPRQARIMGDDGKNGFVQVDPGMTGAIKRDEQRRVVAINLNVGSYDVRVKAGPSFSNVREQAAQQIVELTQGNPQLAAAMAPLLMKLQDLPDSEKAYKVALSMLPPMVQKAYEDEEGEEVPPQAQAAMQQMQQQIQELQQALENAAEAADGKTADQEIARAKLDIEQYKADTDRIKIEQPPEANPTGNVEAELKSAQAEKTRAEAAKTRFEAMQLALTLNAAGVSTESDEMGNPIAPPPQPPSEAQIMSEALAQLVEAQAATARIMAAPKRLMMDEMGNPVGVETVLG